MAAPDGNDESIQTNMWGMYQSSKRNGTGRYPLRKKGWKRGECLQTLDFSAGRWRGFRRPPCMTRIFSGVWHTAADAFHLQLSYEKWKICCGGGRERQSGLTAPSVGRGGCAVRRLRRLKYCYHHLKKASTPVGVIPFAGDISQRPFSWRKWALAAYLLLLPRKIGRNREAYLNYKGKSL